MCAGGGGVGGPQNDGTKAHIDTQTHPEGERGGKGSVKRMLAWPIGTATRAWNAA